MAALVATFSLAAPVVTTSATAEYEALNFGVGAGIPEWDYAHGLGYHGLPGFSYYLRAFNLLRDTPQAQVGWGQWSKPSVADGILEVCGVNPHAFTCRADDPSIDNIIAAEPELAGCGYLDYERLEQCKAGECGEEELGGVKGSIEGGMGYWDYTIETPNVKWMLPGSTNANYEVFGGTFLADRPQQCTSMGGAVRISNRLLIPNDFVSFLGGAETDGFLGYMLTKTPIGKLSATDEANYWTIVIDTANFAGPALYMSSWFWDMRINWNPKSVSWSDSRVNLGYIAEGFEGRIASFGTTDADGTTWRRTNQWALPVDETNPERSTVFTGHRQYKEDWAASAVEPILSGNGDHTARKPAAVLAASRTAGTVPECNNPEGRESSTTHVEAVWTEDEETGTWADFGIGLETDQSKIESGGCAVTMTLDHNKMDCESSPGFCLARKYLAGKSTTVKAGDVPPAIKATLDSGKFQTSRKNDGRFLGPPAETEKACFAAVASETLYCARTASASWISWKWYRFVDQPELNQVFASLPEGEREAAKCYMQARIERLHAAQDSGSVDDARWFDPPQGHGAMPKGLVSLDPALILKPPAGMEVGYVPIPLSQKFRTKPANCVVTSGPHQEPDPLPADYYDGVQMFEGGYETEQCKANSETHGATFTYPGTIYQYSPECGGADRTPYHVPLRTELANSVPFHPEMCPAEHHSPPPCPAPAPWAYHHHGEEHHHDEDHHGEEHHHDEDHHGEEHHHDEDHHGEEHHHDEDHHGEEHHHDEDHFGEEHHHHHHGAGCSTDAFAVGDKVEIEGEAACVVETLPSQIALDYKDGFTTYELVNACDVTLKEHCSSFCGGCGAKKSSSVHAKAASKRALPGRALRKKKATTHNTLTPVPDPAASINRKSAKHGVHRRR
jgi:hypothetical protein